MGVYIKGMEMPKNCFLCPLSYMRNERLFCFVTKEEVLRAKIATECPIVHVPPHGRLIDADALRAKMYHEAFETDTPMQKWDSGCWIRYKLFERTEETAPTIIPAKEGE